MTDHSGRSLFIVRHGETAFNAARRLQMPETPLSPIGEAQAERLGRRLMDAGITRIISSDYPRALATAAAVADRVGLAIDTDERLRERNFGELRGMAYDSLPRSPFAPDFAPPGGESAAEFLARVAEAWRLVTGLAQQATGNLLVVTHGLVCRAMVEHHVHAASRGDMPTQWYNTSVTEIDVAPPWLARRVNCVEHLVD
jgi:broad specificity phosphatase PhoE